MMAQSLAAGAGRERSRRELPRAVQGALNLSALHQLNKLLGLRQHRLPALLKHAVGHTLKVVVERNGHQSIVLLDGGARRNENPKVGLSEPFGGLPIAELQPRILIIAG